MEWIEKLCRNPNNLIHKLLLELGGHAIGLE